MVISIFTVIEDGRQTTSEPKGSLTHSEYHCDSKRTWKFGMTKGCRIKGTPKKRLTTTSTSSAVCGMPRSICGCRVWGAVNLEKTAHIHKHQPHELVCVAHEPHAASVEQWSLIQTARATFRRRGGKLNTEFVGKVASRVCTVHRDIGKGSLVPHYTIIICSLRVVKLHFAHYSTCIIWFYPTTKSPKRLILFVNLLNKNLVPVMCPEHCIESK